VINNKPSKAVEKAWLQRVAEYGCVVTGQSNVQLHHCVGREGKHNKYHIGRLFTLPLCFELHDVSSNHEWNITHHRNKFIEEFGLESEIFSEMCRSMDDPLPFSDDEMAAIMDTGR